MDAAAAIKMAIVKTHQLFFIYTVLYGGKVNISLLSMKVQ
jgi:hypothetical protein